MLETPKTKEELAQAEKLMEDMANLAESLAFARPEVLSTTKIGKIPPDDKLLERESGSE